MSTIESLDAPSEKGAVNIAKEFKMSAAQKDRTDRKSIAIGEDGLDVGMMKLGARKSTLTKEERRRLVIEQDKKKAAEKKAADKGGKSKLCTIF